MNAFMTRNLLRNTAEWCRLIATVALAVVVGVGVALDPSPSMAGEPPTLSWQRFWQGEAATNETHQLLAQGSNRIFVAGNRGGPAEVEGTYLLSYDLDGNLLWDVPFVGNVDERVSGLATLDSGDLISVSRLVLTGDFDEQIVIRKILYGGSVEWTSTYDLVGTNNGEHEPLLALGTDGGPVIGYYDDGDFLLLKYDAGGTLEWSQTFDGDASSLDFMTDLVVADDGSIHFVGIADNYQTYLAVSVDAAGIEVWRRALSGLIGVLEDAFVAQGPDARIVVTGNPESACGSQEQRTWKLDLDGSIVWENLVPDDPCGLAIAVDLDIDDAGNVILVGNLSDVPPHVGMHVRKVSGVDGSLIWENIFDGPGFNSLAEGLVRDLDGNIYVTGWEVISAQDRDVATVMYSADGVEEWFEIWSGDGATNDLVAAIAVDEARAITLAGATFDPVSFEDGFVVRYEMDDPASIPSAPNDFTEGFGPGVVAFPNPSSGQVSLRLSNAVFARSPQAIEVLTTEGRRVALVDVPTGEQSLSWRPTGPDGRRLADGIYYLRALPTRTIGGTFRSSGGRMVLLSGE